MTFLSGTKGEEAFSVSGRGGYVTEHGQKCPGKGLSNEGPGGNNCAFSLPHIMSTMCFILKISFFRNDGAAGGVVLQEGPCERLGCWSDASERRWKLPWGEWMLGSLGVCLVGGAWETLPFLCPVTPCFVRGVVLLHYTSPPPVFTSSQARRNMAS